MRCPAIWIQFCCARGCASSESSRRGHLACGSWQLAEIKSVEFQPGDAAFTASCVVGRLVTLQVGGLFGYRSGQALRSPDLIIARGQLQPEPYHVAKLELFDIGRTSPHERMLD